MSVQSCVWSYISCPRSVQILEIQPSFFVTNVISKQSCTRKSLVNFITGRNEVLAKVIFLHVSVILLTGGGGILGGYFFWGGIPPNFGGGFSTGIRSTFGRYASYWNAFLFKVF